MKNWINRLISSSDGANAEATRGEDDVPEENTLDPAAEIDRAYYRWLTGSSAYDAATDTEDAILGAIEATLGSPGEAADLVPRAPEVIPQLLRSLHDDDASATQLAQQVAQDVVLVAEVLREANSSYYRPLMPVKTVEAAIMMLGQNGLRVLLARLAFRPLIQMQPHGFARRAAPQIWSHSEKCAHAASLLAPGLTADAFESYLAGLMQGVGLVVAFRLADTLCEGGKVPRSDEFGARLLAAGRQLSAAIATHWEFPQSVADAIAHTHQASESNLAEALALGDRIAKLRLLIDNFMLLPEDPLVTEGLDPFQRRCLGKLSNLDT
jgi:HD-like signal output (HDOD) protein